jgi:hypothetical protein
LLRVYRGGSFDRAAEACRSANRGRTKPWHCYGSVGFRPGPPTFSGFVPPLPKGPDLSFLEGFLERIPLLRRGAYFYRLTAVKQSADP